MAASPLGFLSIFLLLLLFSPSVAFSESLLGELSEAAWDEILAQDTHFNNRRADTGSCAPPPPTSTPQQLRNGDFYRSGKTAAVVGTSPNEEDALRGLIDWDAVDKHLAWGASRGIEPEAELKAEFFRRAFRALTRRRVACAKTVDCPSAASGCTSVFCDQTTCKCKYSELRFCSSLCVCSFSSPSLSLFAPSPRS
jgi:hypothetical protein